MRTVEARRSTARLFALRCTLRGSQQCNPLPPKLGLNWWKLLWLAEGVPDYHRGRQPRIFRTCCWLDNMHFCRKNTTQNMNCPVDNPIASRCNLGYVNLAANLVRVMRVSPHILLPSKLVLHVLDVGSAGSRGVIEIIGFLGEGRSYPKSWQMRRLLKKFADSVGPSPSDLCTRSTLAAHIST
jgi:hypothetical protein